VERGFEVMAQQGEEAGNGKGLVAIAQHLPVDSVFVEDVGDQGYDGIHGDHEEDTDDVFLLVRLRVVRRMLHHEEEGDCRCDGGEGGGEEKSEVMEGEALPQRGLSLDCSESLRQLFALCGVSVSGARHATYQLHLRW
jgi:hypothetical protein